MHNLRATSAQSSENPGHVRIVAGARGRLGPAVPGTLRPGLVALTVPPQSTSVSPLFFSPSAGSAGPGGLSGVTAQTAPLHVSDVQSLSSSQG